MDGVLICGSLGERALLTKKERMKLAEKWLEVAGDKLKVIIHTGSTNIMDQKALAAHAQHIGL